MTKVSSPLRIYRAGSLSLLGKRVRVRVAHSFGDLLQDAIDIT